MANEITNVTTAKPKVGGAVFRAPLGTTLPISADAPLGSAFNSLGYISDAGIKKAIERTTEEIKAWGGDVVASPQTEYKEKFTMAFLEALKEEVLKAVYVDDNVSGDISSGITVSGNSKEHQPHIWVIDTVLNGNILARLVIPNGKVTEVGEVEYADGAPISHEVTISALPDSSGNCHYEYIKQKEEVE